MQSIEYNACLSILRQVVVGELESKRMVAEPRKQWRVCDVLVGDELLYL